MLLPGFLCSGCFQLLKISQLGIELVHPVGLRLVAHVVLLQQLACGLARSESLNNLHAAVAPALGHPVDILLKTVNIRVLGHVWTSLFHSRSDMLHILNQLVDQALQEKNFSCSNLESNICKEVFTRREK